MLAVLQALLGQLVDVEAEVKEGEPVVRVAGVVATVAMRVLPQHHAGPDAYFVAAHRRALRRL